MSKYSVNSFWKSFGFAYRGLRLIIKSQRNFRRQVCFALIGLFLAALLSFNYIEICILLLSMGLVLLTEMINTAIEFSIDAYTKNKYSKLVEMAKDMAAGCVLFSTVLSTIVCSILFLHKIYILFL